MRIPRIEIQGATGAMPRLWPMQIGRGRPVLIEACRGVGARGELSWDKAGRLLEIRRSFPAEPVHMREVYRWRGDELEGIRYFDAKVADVFGDEPSSEEVWTWEAGLPREVRRPRERNMAAPDRVKTIGFRYDDAGRLIAQTSSNPPGGDEWLYRYDTP